MLTKEKSLYSIMPDITPKIDNGEVGFSLRSRDYKDSQIICTAPRIYDARGNGNGKTVSTITGDHENRITDYTAVCIEEKEMEQEMVVRRLTPLECTRLQGYPDKWVDIGEWTDSKGKVHKDADSPKYKALGNSIALPFWQWIADRICKQYDYEPTMASLFDGIGGFPLVFSGCGCKPVWCSEIEEFPIAVTKRHFPEEEE